MTSSTIGMSHELANTLNVQAALDELVKTLIASIATRRWYRRNVRFRAKAMFA